MAGPVSEFEVRAKEHFAAASRRAAELAGGDLPSLAARAGAMLAESLAAGGTVLFCGNGGSAADAQHLAAELLGRMSGDRDPLAGLALTTDTSALTALANDYGYEEVFARQIRGLGRRGDVLVALSTSGDSENVVRAARTATERGIRVVALVGPGASRLDEHADVTLHVPGESTGEIQQGHIVVGHLLCSLAETAAGT
ncbi:MAG TPA: SIS domain-containing protein [Actinomycetota bacterium]|nr:SIS domain-containing protein [Actinomycetota bacterium]